VRHRRLLIKILSLNKGVVQVVANRPSRMTGFPTGIALHI
jgi:hypothetical protein